jgi:hypothetical protein
MLPMGCGWVYAHQGETMGEHRSAWRKGPPSVVTVLPSVCLPAIVLAVLSWGDDHSANPAPPPPSPAERAETACLERAGNDWVDNRMKLFDREAALAQQGKASPEIELLKRRLLEAFCVRQANCLQSITTDQRRTLLANCLKDKSEEHSAGDDDGGEDMDRPDAGG